MQMRIAMILQTYFQSRAAFTAKAAAWPTEQASANGSRRPLLTLRKECGNRV